MKQTLGERVKEKRMLLGFSVQELADRAQVSASYIYAIEAGVRGSRIEKLIRIAKALEMSIVDIWPYDS